MINFMTFFLPGRLLQPLLKPVIRLFLGVVAIPFFRLFVRRVVKVQEINQELEKDLEQWFRGALLLLIATKNMEESLFSWVTQETLDGPLFLAGRLLLAISVVEGMPDQSLFALIHPGPQPPKFKQKKIVWSLICYIPQLFKGIICQHLNRSSPVFAILAVLVAGKMGWICYGIALAQYLLIGLVTSRDKALNVLQRFDAAVDGQRQRLESELKRQTESRKLREAGTHEGKV
jgi:hypothetical protein